MIPGRKVAWLLVLATSASALGSPVPQGGPTVLIPAGAVWKYRDTGSNQGTAWRAVAFNDAAWASGPAQLGYGDGDEATVVSYGPDPNNKHVTTYFRKSFTVAAPAMFTSLTLSLLRDDGAVAYLNGTQVFRTNMPAGTITFTTLASAGIGGAEESTFYQIGVNPALLQAGTNLLAVEVHQAAVTSSDISFDLQLTGATGAGTAAVTRGPYLQRGSPTGAVVRWRTDTATNSRVRFGPAPGSLTSNADDPAVVTEHVVAIGGLLPDTTYYYSVGTTAATLAGGDAAHFFLTPPAAGTAKPTRVWVVGDSGTADANAAAVRDAYQTFTGTAHTDLWLMLGDNAYSTGTDAEYQAAVFNMYPAMLRKSVLWPTRGNHEFDGGGTGSTYYSIFTLPAAAEAGGLASGTEAYYSFNYGNIHFICLDSYGSDRSPGGAMATWLWNDLASASQTWIVAYWHHPPYTKGSHDSDWEGELVEMRQNILPILEDWGVDLVLSGHSHSYERSFLIDGHYGASTTFTEAMKKNGGDGSPDGAGAYVKPDWQAPHAGAVYAVAGSSGLTSGGPLNHPAMYISLNQLGSMVLDFNGNTLDAKFLRSTGQVADSFRVQKQAMPATSTLVPPGYWWAWLDNGSDPGPAWTSPGFDDSLWPWSVAQFGYGDGDEATVVGYGPDPNNKYVTTYFRSWFEIADPAAYSSLILRLLRDDGAVVHLNGVEVHRSNMPAGPIGTATLAAVGVGGADESTFYETSLSASLLVPGWNSIAVEVHQAAVASSDISFDLQLLGVAVLGASVPVAAPAASGSGHGGGCGATGAEFLLLLGLAGVLRWRRR